MRVGEAVLSAGARLAPGTGRIVLAGLLGVATFPVLEPAQHVLWTSAEFRGVNDPVDPGVRIRLTDGTNQFWIDPDGALVRPVADPSSWDADYNFPAAMCLLSKWTAPRLGFIVALVDVSGNPSPTVGQVDVAFDLPAWEGATAQAALKVVEAVGAVRPIMVESVVPSEDAGEAQWSLGAPYSEHGIELTELVQVTVNGVHRSASLQDGTITLAGPTKAPRGSTVKIAVKYAPNVSVRRMGNLRFVEKLPAWVVSSLVSVGGLSGRMAPVDINGFEVERRRIELKMTVRGMAERSSDALAMRAALQAAFAQGALVQLDSCRTFVAHIDGLVEVLAQGNTAVPEAVGIVQLALEEAVSGRWVRLPTESVSDGQGGMKDIMRTNMIAMELSDAGVTVRLTADTDGVAEYDNGGTC